MGVNQLPVSVARGERLTASLVNALNDRLHYLERLFQRRHDAAGRHDCIEVPRLVMQIWNDGNDNAVLYPASGPPADCTVVNNLLVAPGLVWEVTLNNPVGDPRRYGPGVGALVVRVQSNSDYWTTAPCGAHYYQRGEQRFCVGAWRPGAWDLDAMLTVAVHVGRRRDVASGPPVRRDDIARAKSHLAPVQAGWDAFARNLDELWSAANLEHDSGGEHLVTYEEPHGCARVYCVGTTYAIRASKNVTSVTRIGLGHVRIVCPVSKGGGAVFVSGEPTPGDWTGAVPSLCVLTGVPQSSMNWAAGTFDVYIYTLSGAPVDASFGFTYHVTP